MVKTISQINICSQLFNWKSHYMHKICSILMFATVKMCFTGVAHINTLSCKRTPEE